VWRAVTLREWADTLVRDDPMPGLVDAGRILGRLGRNLGKLGRLATRSAET
jgi:hypothetical protein